MYKKMEKEILKKIIDIHIYIQIYEIFIFNSNLILINYKIYSISEYVLW